MRRGFTLLVSLVLISGVVSADAPRGEELKKLLAEARMTSGEYEKAKEQYREILKANPDDVKTRADLADVLSWNKEYGEAIFQYKKVLEVSPNDVFVQKRLAEVYMWDKKYKSAEKIYKDIIKKNPFDTEACTSLGEMLVWQKRYSEANSFFMKALDGKHSVKAKLLYGRSLLYSAQYAPAEDVFKEILRSYPENTEAEMYLADTFAYSKQFTKAIRLYKEILAKKPNPEIELKLADVLSWNRQYRESLLMYDNILSRDNDPKVRLQKARILGWDKQYAESLKEYSRVLASGENESVRLEAEAKKANWGSRVEQAIDDYRRLLTIAPENTEAGFDLSQIYSYQSMWAPAKEEYKKILKIFPNHFRAREGLEKIELESKHPSWRAGYEYFEGDSPSRMTDINEQQFFNKIRLPVADKLNMEVDYLLTGRCFSDFHDLLENKGKIKFIYRDMPGFSASGYYGLLAYNKDVDECMHLFGGEIAARIFDAGTFSCSYDKEDLDNMSLVIRRHEYRNKFKPRVVMDLNRNVKLGTDYTYAYYSDDNFKHEPAFDVACLLSRDPLRFLVKYRYFYRQFKSKVPDYFSPKGFSTSTFTLNWRHYLNKEEIFYGANDFYYDLEYDVIVDSTFIVGNKLTWELNWDLNKRLNFNVKGVVMGSSANVYNEKNIEIGVKYYF